MLILKLIAVHLLVDFFLQSDASIKDKEEKKFKSPKLFIHVLLHGVLTFIVLIPESIGAYWMVAPVIMVSHWIIDGFKLQLQSKKKKKQITWFLADQATHLLVIAGVWLALEGNLQIIEGLYTEDTLLILLAVLFLTNPSAIIVKILISGWSPTEKKDDHSMANAGKYIGILERLFVFGFVISNNWEGIGFLLAAKSVFRFGDLNDAKDRNLTEYVLIGTFLSFGIAILTGVLYNLFVN
jgi:hypothetical protein